MSRFVPRWSLWGKDEEPSPDEESVKTGYQDASETSKRASAGSAGPQVGHSERSSLRLAGAEDVVASDGPSGDEPGSRLDSHQPSEGHGRDITFGEDPETGHQGTGKTSRKTSEGVAGAQAGHSQVLPAPVQATEASSEPSEASVGRQRTPCVEEMTLEDFAQAGLIVEVNSAVLGSRVLFVSDNVPDSRLAEAELPIYRAAELRRLAVLKPEPRTLRSLHEVKTIFEGAISDVRPNDED